MKAQIVGCLCGAMVLLGCGAGAWAAAAPAGKPAGMVQVPKVVGMPRGTAWTTLTSAGLTPLQGSVVPAKGPVQNETVAAQRPPPSSARVPAGTTVTLDMYSFDGVAVPNVLGMLTSEAAKTMSKAGLKWQLRKQVIITDPTRLNRIAVQDPPAGTMVKKGTLVRGDWTQIVSWRPK